MLTPKDRLDRAHAAYIKADNKAAKAYERYKKALAIFEKHQTRAVRIGK